RIILGGSSHLLDSSFERLLGTSSDRADPSSGRSPLLIRSDTPRYHDRILSLSLFPPSPHLWVWVLMRVQVYVRTLRSSGNTL
ncbi:hypothetical protein LEMLEM_LOCUS1636, partial [Lemmus lemmus]